MVLVRRIESTEKAVEKGRSAVEGMELESASPSRWHFL